MPFDSEKQRRYMWMHYPDIARRWSEEYGSKPKKSNKRKARGFKMKGGLMK
jgi:hypothetical protein